MHRILELLATRGWQVEAHQSAELHLAPDVQRRYALLPNDVREFIGRIVCCVSPEEDSWILGGQDYQDRPSPGFPWDGIERLGLEQCESPEERAAQSAFWDKHFPIAMSLRADYDYLAVCLKPDQLGAVVHGYAPEWERPGVVAESFGDFLEAFERALLQPTPSYPYSVFL